MEDIDGDVLREECSRSYPMESLRAYLRTRSLNAYDQKRDMVEEVESGLMIRVEKYIILTQMNLWREHLQAIKFLQQAVGLRGYAQRDPLTEYKIEGYDLFFGKCYIR